ncbi:hypothetical protein AAHK20_01165 [Trinickia sp. YCB016]
MHAVAKESKRCRVLTERMRERLSAVNCATRALRAMGYRVVRTTIDADREGPPLVEVSKGVRRMTGKPLSPSPAQRLAGCTEASVRRRVSRFMDVSVLWTDG